MIINLNNKKEELPDNSTVGELLKLKNIKTRKIAIWVNGNQLLMKEYEDYVLNEEDKVKTLNIVGGG